MNCGSLLKVIEICFWKTRRVVFKVTRRFFLDFMYRSTICKCKSQHECYRPTEFLRNGGTTKFVLYRSGGQPSTRARNTYLEFIRPWDPSIHLVIRNARHAIRRGYLGTRVPRFCSIVLFKNSAHFEGLLLNPSSDFPFRHDLWHSLYGQRNNARTNMWAVICEKTSYPLWSTRQIGWSNSPVMNKSLCFHLISLLNCKHLIQGL